MFVHFGLYSILGTGEWSKHSLNISDEAYESLKDRFEPKQDWAAELVKIAKNAGCKYITLTTRHHDGFSLYDTCGLNDYDAPHAKCGRDLIREFVDACNQEGIIPFFYHTLLDWREESYQTDFPKYLEYLRKSVEIICKNYGKIGGIWFDGMWDSTFRVAADFCEKYDGFIFNHNESILYEWVEEYEPALFERIQKLVKEGKWRIMGGWYLQPDCVMPSGESFIRQIEVGNQYFEEKFGVKSETAVNFDPFGHNRGLVQILTKKGYENYVFVRPLGMIPEQNFIWNSIKKINLTRYH